MRRRFWLVVAKFAARRAGYVVQPYRPVSTAEWSAYSTDGGTWASSNVTTTWNY